MRINVAAIAVLVASSSASAQPAEPATPASAPHAVEVYGALFPVTDLHLDAQRGALVGGMLEARVLFRNRVGVGVVPFSFSFGELDPDNKRGRMRRHGLGPRLQVLPTDSRFDLTLGYDLNYLVYADGVERELFFRTVIWDERRSLAHSFSVRADFLVGSDQARHKPFGFLIGLIADGGWTADRSSWWFSGGVSFGGRLQTPRPEPDSP